MRLGGDMWCQGVGEIWGATCGVVVSVSALVARRLPPILE